MTSEIGPLDPKNDAWPELSERVAIIFGGVTRSGDRRARREIRKAFANDCDVVWFDAWEGEDHSGLTIRRHVFEENSDHRVLVVACRAEERALLVNRLPNAPRYVISRLEKSPFGRLPGMPGLLGLIETAWRRLARPVFVAIAKSSRGVLAWQRLESRIRAVAAHVPSPECVVYVDDYSLPVAWNAARSIWHDCPAGGGFISRQVSERS